MKSRVEILLKAGTPTPAWIAMQDRLFQRRRQRFGDHQVPALVIRNGMASFIGGGSMEVRLPSSKYSRVAFLPGQVLEIRDGLGSVLKRNHYACERCADTNSRVIERRPGTISGLYHSTYACQNIGCGNQWTCLNT